MMGFAHSIFWVFLVLAAAVIAVLVAIAQTSRLEPIAQPTVEKRGYAIRRWWFRSIVAILIAGFAVTIPFFPYQRAGAAGVAVTYKVTAQQYGFTVPQTVPFGKRVDFAVTAGDVNHGFGIYDPQGRIVGQVQAMPHYVNHLQIVFTERGTYTVRCLEFCGIGHAYMRSQFEVK